MDTTGSVDNIEPTTAVDVPIPPGTQEVFGGYQPTLLVAVGQRHGRFPLQRPGHAGHVPPGPGDPCQRRHRARRADPREHLNLTGPVTVPGIAGTISAGNVAEVLLHQQYAQLLPVPSAQRHDNISAVAKAAFDKMKTEHIDLAALANALATDVDGSSPHRLGRGAQVRIDHQLARCVGFDRHQPTRTDLPRGRGELDRHQTGLLREDGEQRPGPHHRPTATPW